MKFRVVGILCVVMGAMAFTSSASATPVATNDASYSGLGRVFPDPLAGCAPGAPACDPNAQGNVPAIQFIQYQEFVNALTYMNANPDWAKYMEVQVLDGKIAANGAGEAVPDADLGIGSPGASVFPGNNLPLDYDPKPEFKSAGLATTTLGRQSSDLIVVRVTDESVPDAGKKRYALSLSIHGIERAGVEGGTRAMEDLVTAGTTGRSNDPVVPANPAVPDSADSPSFEQILKKTIVYFTYPESRRLAPRIRHRGRHLLPALQRQRSRRQPRLAGHRLLVPPLQRPVRAREPRAVGVLRRRRGQRRPVRRR